MLISIELDVDKYQNESLIRAFFANSNSPFYKQNYTFNYDQKKCFKQTINIKVRKILKKFQISYFHFYFHRKTFEINSLLSNAD